MPEAWTGGVVGRLHVLGIQHRELAARVGITNRYLAMVLNGHRHPKGMEVRLNEALDEMEKERDAKNKTESPAC